MFEYIIKQAHISSAVISCFLKNYPIKDLVVSSSNVLTCNIDNCSQIQIERFKIDLMFFDSNPILPLENLCSHLETYKLQNDSQSKMLNYANKLILLDDNSIGAGLFMWGEAGIGKSHIAVGISKKFMLKGLSTNFQFADRFNYKSNLDLKPSQVWVIDDLNNGYGLVSQLFKKVVLNAHEHGGRVFITSNKDYDELIREMFVGDGNANKTRYDDRTKGMFKILNVTGKSFRQANFGIMINIFKNSYQF